ncbi:MAG: hypothetical protein GQ554_03005, partial [Deltaproteobacteria bacterium]|nr:hypothetical protein [Deltaproteobacteria bacterium]
YTLAPAPAVGEFADLIPVNTDVRDDSDDILNVTPLPGKVGSECQGDGDCNDYNECTNDTCNGGLCEYANIAGPCDDGIFCNGNDTCSGGSCSVNSGDPCPVETTCNEATNACDAPPINPTSTSTTTTAIAECESDADCDDDELFCNGDEICIKGECQHEGSPCTDDELFCNGEESCDEENDECISSGDPCPGGTTCFEETDECRSMGTCVISIEPETAAVVSEQSLNFTINKTGDCDDPDYEWSVQSEAGSAVDQNGKYVAGINTDCSQELTDVIKLVDHANEFSVEATATVSCDRIIGVINISNPLWILFPSEIYSSHWLPLPHVLFIFAEQGNFDQTSSLSFEPIGSITTLLNVGIDDIMIALVLVGPNAQEGFYRATVLTDSDMVTKKEALIMNMMPWILDEE